jgi:hypothetical protein
VNACIDIVEDMDLRETHARGTPACVVE